MNTDRSVRILVLAAAMVAGCASPPRGAAEGVLAVAEPLAGGEQAIFDWPAPAVFGPTEKNKPLQFTLKPYDGMEAPGGELQRPTE